MDTIVNAFDIHVPNKAIYHYNGQSNNIVPHRYLLSLGAILF